VLDQTSLYSKIVPDRRGGFCYELNGLFCCLLRELGYVVTMLSAGVAKPDGSFGPDFDHMALLVELDEPWIADVGFGDSFIEPIHLDPALVSEDETGAYRVEQQQEFRIMVKRTEPGDWKAQYRFTLQARELADYEEMCIHQQTSPESHFTQGRICSMATETGRITLSELRLIETKDGSRVENQLRDELEFRKVLAERFGAIL
jgi:N-hydroxyarylamine O-acetyltransferase